MTPIDHANEIWRDRGAAGYQDRAPYAIRMGLGVLGVVVLIVWLALSACQETTTDVDRRAAQEITGLLTYQGYLPPPSEPNEIPQEFLEDMARDLAEVALPPLEDM